MQVHPVLQNKPSRPRVEPCENKPNQPTVDGANKEWKFLPSHKSPIKKNRSCLVSHHVCVEDTLDAILPHLFVLLFCEMVKDLKCHGCPRGTQDFWVGMLLVNFGEWLESCKFFWNGTTSSHDSNTKKNRSEKDPESSHNKGLKEAHVARQSMGKFPRLQRWFLACCKWCRALHSA